MIRELQVIFQKPMDPEELSEREKEGKPVFATQGQSEVKEIAQVGLDQWVENTLDIVPVNLPVGVSGMSDMIRRAVLRHIASRKGWKNDWRFFYVIATFEKRSGESFFRTVIPRTAITVQFRNLRHRKQGHR